MEEKPTPENNRCTLEIKSLDGEITLIHNVSVHETRIADVFEIVRDIEQPGREFKLMGVVNGRLVSMKIHENDRTLAGLGFQPDGNYRIEVCLAWHELKKVLM